MSAQSFEPPAAATGKQSTQITTIRVTNAASGRSYARAIGLPCTEKTKRRGVRRSLCGADSGVGIGLPSCDEPERRTRRLSPRHRWRRGRLPPPMIGSAQADKSRKTRRRRAKRGRCDGNGARAGQPRRRQREGLGSGVPVPAGDTGGSAPATRNPERKYRAGRCCGLGSAQQFSGEWAAGQDGVTPLVEGNPFGQLLGAQAVRAAGNRIDGQDDTVVRPCVHRDTARVGLTTPSGTTGAAARHPW